jgi:hypothetical protein
MPRDLNAILAAAVKLIFAAQRDPPAESVELFQTTLDTTISTVRGIHEKTASLPSPAEMKDNVDDYLKALRTARKKAYAVAPFYWSFDFAAALNQEAREVKARAGLPVPHGAQQRDLIADMAARAARDLLEVRFIFPKDRPLPAVANPWRQDARLTKGRLWLKLAALIYKGATGKRPPDMMLACRDFDKPLLRLPYSSTPRSPRPKSRPATAAPRR